MFNKDYEQLYYKYKTKYLNLKKELYGGKNKTFNEHLEEYIHKNFPNTPPFPNTDPDWIEDFRNAHTDLSESERISEIDFGNLLQDFNNTNNVVTQSLYDYYLIHHRQLKLDNKINQHIVDEITKKGIPQDITNMNDLHTHFSNSTHRETRHYNKGQKNKFNIPPQRPVPPRTRRNNRNNP